MTLNSQLTAEYDATRVQQPVATIINNNLSRLDDCEVPPTHIYEGKHQSNMFSLWLKSIIQYYFFRTGRFVARYRGKVIFLVMIVLFVFSLGLRSVHFSTDFRQMLFDESERTEEEVNYFYRSSSTLEDFETRNLQDSGSVSAILQQSASTNSDTVLLRSAFLTHLHVLREASLSVVTIHGIQWTLVDICLKYKLLYSHKHLEQSFENLIPCHIITPLDCFWDASTLPFSYAAHFGVFNVGGWTSFNPNQTLFKLQPNLNQFSFSNINHHFQEMGIGSGYMHKPCLNLSDIRCLHNNLSYVLDDDLTSYVRDGCAGLVARYMQWSPEVLFGGISLLNGSMTRARSLMSSWTLMGERNLYEYYQNHYKVHSLFGRWSVEMAREVLLQWTQEFSSRVRRLCEHLKVPYQMHTFSEPQLDSLFEQNAGVNVYILVSSLIILVMYAVMSSMMYSILMLYALGTVIYSVAASVGLCAMLGWSFTPLTAQVLPAIAVIYGLNCVLLMVQTYLSADMSSSNTEDIVGATMKDCALTLTSTAACVISCSLSVAIIPLTALRTLSFMVTICAGVSYVSILLLFSALLSFEISRRNSRTHTPRGPPLHLERSRTFHANNRRSCISAYVKRLYLKVSTTNKSRALFVVASICCACAVLSLAGGVFSLRVGMETYMTVPAYTQHAPSTRTHTWLGSLAASIGSLPLSTKQYARAAIYSFARAFSRLYGVYNWRLVVTHVNYNSKRHQLLFLRLRRRLTALTCTIPADRDTDSTKMAPSDGDFWLSTFTSWLLRLQRRFDNEWAPHLMNATHVTPNRSLLSDEAVLAYKLLVQTGRPLSRTAHAQVTHTRLVARYAADVSGNRTAAAAATVWLPVVRPQTFYSYVTAWRTFDRVHYENMRAQLQPEPVFWHEGVDTLREPNFRVPQSRAFVRTHMWLQTRHVHNSSAMIGCLSAVNAICRQFSTLHGVNAFPVSDVFQLSHHLLYISEHVQMLLVALCVVLVLVVALLSTLYTSLFVFSYAVLLAAQSLGTAVTLLGVCVNAFSVLALVISLAVCVISALQLTLMFVHCAGSRHQRVSRTFSTVSQSALHFSVVSLLFLAPSAQSQYEILTANFFLPIMLTIAIVTVNNFTTLPLCLLSWFAPPTDQGRGSQELVANHSQPLCVIEPNNQSCTATRVSGPRVYRSSSLSRRAIKNTNLPAAKQREMARANSLYSLSTISEEHASQMSDSTLSHGSPNQNDACTVTTNQNDECTVTTNQNDACKVATNENCAGGKSQTNRAESGRQEIHLRPQIILLDTNRVQVTATASLELHVRDYVTHTNS